MKADIFVVVVIFLTFWYLKGNSSDGRHPISIVRGRKGNNKWLKEAKKEFRWSKVVKKENVEMKY